MQISVNKELTNIQTCERWNIRKLVSNIRSYTYLTQQKIKVLPMGFAFSTVGVTGNEWKMFMEKTLGKFPYGGPIGIA